MWRNHITERSSASNPVTCLSRIFVIESAHVMKISRRQTLRSLAMAGVAFLCDRRSLLRAQASQAATPVHFQVPAGSCDCHVHVFGDPAKYPFAATRTYTPPGASTGELRRLLAALHMDRVVVVQPSVYGTDNRCTVDAIRELGSRARGVAVIDDGTPDAALDEMAHAGIRGIRINLTQGGVTDPAVALKRFERAAERAARLRRCPAARPGTRRGKFPAHPLGNELAASGLEACPRTQEHGHRAAHEDRRWTGAESAARMGAGRPRAANDPRRESGQALRVHLERAGRPDRLDRQEGRSSCPFAAFFSRPRSRTAALNPAPPDHRGCRTGAGVMASHRASPVCR